LLPPEFEGTVCFGVDEQIEAAPTQAAQLVTALAFMTARITRPARACTPAASWSAAITEFVKVCKVHLAT